MKHIIVKGIVQNVFFRDNTKKKAKEFGMKGSVKNLEDGSVEIFVKENKNLNVFIEWCKKGPLLAKVESVDIEDVKEENFDDFSVKY